MSYAIYDSKSKLLQVFILIFCDYVVDNFLSLFLSVFKVFSSFFFDKSLQFFLLFTFFYIFFFYRAHTSTIDSLNILQTYLKVWKKTQNKQNIGVCFGSRFAQFFDDFFDFLPFALILEHYFFCDPEDSRRMWTYFLLLIPFTLAFLLGFTGFRHWWRRRNLLKNLKGRHVFITGGTKGIGLELARLCVEFGANVTVLARNKKILNDAKLELIKLSIPSMQKVLAYSVDVSESVRNVKIVVEEAEAESGPIDLLVCCAGTAIAREFHNTKEEEFKHLMSVNYFGTVNTVHAALESLKKSQNSPNILLFSSLAGLFGLYGYSAYSASKFALVGFAQVLSMELASDNIGVTVSYPPDTDTPGFELEQVGKPKLTQSFSEEGGLVQPRVVAQAALIDALDREFASTVGLNGKVLSFLCSGMSPTRSWFLCLVEVFSMSLLRIFGLQFVWSCHSQVRKHGKQQNSSKTE